MSLSWVDLSPPANKDNHDLTALNEIDPVSGPVIDPQLRDALANGLGIPGVPE